MRNKCKQCGQCCNDVWLTWSPKELRVGFDAWDNSKKGVAYVGGIHLIYPMLRFKFKKGKYWHYRCVHVEQRKDKKWYCGIHKIKPKMCEQFPYSGGIDLRMGGKPNKPSQYEGCGFNV